MGHNPSLEKPHAGWEPWPRGVCESGILDRSEPTCIKRGRWMVDGRILCGEHAHLLEKKR